jgi:hypothetical protein
MERVAKMWAKIADETNCSIELVHHSRKTGGAEVTVEDGRGAGALLAAVRSARVLNPMSQDEANKAGIENRRLHFRVENGKANLVRPVDQATWYKLASVDLANGDDVGVVTPWEWPNPFDGITVADLRAAQQAVSDGGPWRENITLKGAARQTAAGETRCPAAPPPLMGCGVGRGTAERGAAPCGWARGQVARLEAQKLGRSHGGALALPAIGSG